MKSLTLKSLEKDKADLEGKMQTLQRQISSAQVQLYRLDGALGYVIDNIKALKEKEDDR